MPKIYLSGGIGNQLFQVAFGHFLNSLNMEDVVIEKPKLRTGLPHTHLSFFNSNYECEHCIYRIHTGNEHWNRLVNPWDKRSRIKKSKNKIDLRHQPFVTPEEIPFSDANSVFLGYFQNEAFVRPIEKILRHEIIGVLEERKTMSLADAMEGELEVIHIRQGDTSSIENKKRVGILSRDFYSTLLNKRTKYDKRIVVTDDILGAQTTLDGFLIDQFYGPEELDAWESLSVMAKSKRLIGANSTFSWWGGFLAVQNGAEVIIPEPFFVNPELETNGAFKYPGFSEVRSTFIT